MELEEMEVKKTEDSGQMAYSKRRKSIFKKAHELALASDAEVSIIMCSGDKKFHEYTSPSSTMKKIIDKYQSTLGVDLWSTHYEKMQEELRRLKDVNSTLRREIKLRVGVEVDDDLNMEQLCSLEDDMIKSLKTIHLRKFRILSNQTDVCKKKVRNLQDMQECLRNELVTKYEHPHGLVENEGRYEIPGPLHHRNPRDLRVEGSFERESSTVTMDVEDSP